MPRATAASITARNLSAALIKTEALSMLMTTAVMPLGIYQLASALEARGIPVSATLDLQIVRPEDVRRELECVASRRPAVIGLSAVSHSAGLAASVASFLRRAAPAATLVVGGPVATTDPQGVLDACGVDFAIAGEGEEALPNFVEALAAGGDPRGVPGLVYRDAGTIVRNPPEPLSVTLDELPFPAWDRVDFRRYGKFISGTLRRSPYAALVTSRGCPYRCIFCNNVFGRKFRAQSPESVLAELHLLRRRHGIRRIEFFDDIFNLDGDRAREILSRIRDELPDVRIGFCTGLRADQLDESFFDVLGTVNCYFLGIPVETASPRLQRLIRKDVDLDRVRLTVELARKHRIYTMGFYLVGFPTETPEEVRATFRFARELKTSFHFFSFVSAYQGTALREMIGDEKASTNARVDDGLAAEIHRLRLKVLRAQFLKPRNWYFVYNLVAWRLWWLGPKRLLSHLAAIVQEKVLGRQAPPVGIFERKTDEFSREIRAALGGNGA